MNKLTILSVFFITALVAMLVGVLISHLEISGESKGIAIYACSCVVAYVLYVISGESKRDDLEDEGDE